MVSLPSEFRASLESYHGPLDLLLYLIKQEEIDIFNIPIAELVHQYQLYLSLLQEVDPNTCGEFLVMAARLMEIKSKLLLPRQTVEEDDEEYEDPRMELVRQLLEYKKFKERAILLERRLDLHRRRYERPRIDLPEEEDAGDMGPLDIGNVSVWDLLTAYHRIQIAIGQRAPHQVVVEDRPQEAFIRDVVEELESSPSSVVVFDQLFRGARTRQEVCGYFLALLELAKQYRIVLEQEQQGGDIYVRLRSEEEVRELMEAHRAEMRREEEELGGAFRTGGDAEEAGSEGESGQTAHPGVEEGTRASQDAPDAPGRDADPSSEERPGTGEPIADSRDTRDGGAVDPSADPRGEASAGERP